MKTTVDLPSELIEQIKLHAFHQGRRLKDQMAELLRAGLAADPGSSAKKPQTKKTSRLPIIKCGKATKPSKGLTPQEVDDILLAQEVSWYGLSGR